MYGYVRRLETNLMGYVFMNLWSSLESNTACGMDGGGTGVHLVYILDWMGRWYWHRLGLLPPYTALPGVYAAARESIATMTWTYEVEH